MNTYNAAQFAGLAGVAVKTLQRWEREDRLKPAARTSGNRRLYTQEQLNKLLNCLPKSVRVTVACLRVSSQAQRPDLANQKAALEQFCIARGIAVDEWLSIYAAAFGEIKRQMQYKKEWFGGKVVCVDRFSPSSRMCSVCKHLNTDLELSDREGTCAHCGAHYRRDDNAACNIEQEALRLLGATPVVATSGILARGRKVRPHYAAIPVEASIFKRSLLST
jgi:DNA-binding transcriptional MerR regulator